MAPKMNVYFAGSIRGGRADTALYKEIITFMKAKDFEVQTEHIGDDTIVTREKSDLNDQEIYDRDMEWLKATDALVAEVTQPSLGVGYEIGRAVAMGKPILCLFRPEEGKSLSAMIAGAHSPATNVIVSNYAGDEYKSKITDFLAQLPKK